MARTFGVVLSSSGIGTILIGVFNNVIHYSLVTSNVVNTMTRINIGMPIIMHLRNGGTRLNTGGLTSDNLGVVTTGNLASTTRRIITTIRKGWYPFWLVGAPELSTETLPMTEKLSARGEPLRATLG